MIFGEHANCQIIPSRTCSISSCIVRVSDSHTVSPFSGNFVSDSVWGKNTLACQHQSYWCCRIKGSSSDYSGTPLELECLKACCPLHIRIGMVYCTIPTDHSWYVTRYLTCSWDTLFMTSCYPLQPENLFIHTKFRSKNHIGF
jgi:hypothetical protein